MQKLLKLSDTHYIVVDDSEIKEGDWVINNLDKLIGQTIRPISTAEVNDKEYSKITHSTKPLLDKPHYADYGMLTLSEVEEAIYGYSVEKMAEKRYNESLPNQQMAFHCRMGYKEGFKAHQKLVKYKNIEVIELLKNITDWSSFKEHPIGKQAQRALDILLPKTKWDVEFDEQGKLIIL